METILNAYSDVDFHMCIARGKLDGIKLFELDKDEDISEAVEFIISIEDEDRFSFMMDAYYALRRDYLCYEKKVGRIVACYQATSRVKNYINVWINERGFE